MAKRGQKCKTSSELKGVPDTSSGSMVHSCSHVCNGTFTNRQNSRRPHFLSPLSRCPAVLFLVNSERASVQKGMSKGHQELIIVASLQTSETQQPAVSDREVERE